MENNIINQAVDFVNKQQQVIKLNATATPKAKAEIKINKSNLEMNIADCYPKENLKFNVENMYKGEDNNENNNNFNTVSNTILPTSNNIHNTNGSVHQICSSSANNSGSIKMDIQRCDEIMEGQQKQIINPEFRKYFFRAISIFSNKVGDFLRNDKMIDRFWKFNISANKDKFYSIIQNAVFRSYVKLLEFDESYIKNSEGVEVRRFTPPEDLRTIHDVKSVLFFQSLWYNYGLENNETDIEDVLISFYSDNDNYKINPDFYKLFSDRLYEKLSFTADGIYEIVSYIADLIDYNEISDNECDCCDETEEGEYDRGEMYDDIGGELAGLDIEIYKNTENSSGYKDTILLWTSDTTTNVQIPIYCNLDDDIEKIESINGKWNFLTILQPELHFKTKHPEKWIKLNDVPYDEQYKIVMIDKINEEYLMGIYMVTAIDDETVYKEGDKELEINDVLIEKINAITIKALKGTFLDVNKDIINNKYIEFLDEQSVSDILLVDLKDEEIKTDISEIEKGDRLMGMNGETVEVKEIYKCEDKKEDLNSAAEEILSADVYDKYENMASEDPKYAKYMNDEQGGIQPIRKKNNKDK